MMPCSTQYNLFNPKAAANRIEGMSGISDYDKPRGNGHESLESGAGLDTLLVCVAVKNNRQSLIHPSASA
jgi:hypothetical protein